MSTLPDKPQITNGEVTEALKVAHQLGWYRERRDESNCIWRENISEMEMLQVLEAAFNHRHERFNGELRREAARLDQHMAVTRMRTKKYEDMRDVVLWARAIRDHIERLLKLLEDTRVVRISDEFRSLRGLLDQDR